MALYTTTNRRLNAIIKSSKGASYTVGLITIFVVVLMLFLAILPAYRSITDQIKNNDAKTEYMQKLKDKKAVMDKLMLEYEANKATIEQFNADFPSKPDNELIVANLSKIASSYNTLMISASFSKVIVKSQAIAQIPDRMSAIPATVVFQGKLADLEKVVAHLERFPIPFNLYTFTYSFGTQSNGSKSATYNTSDAIFTMNVTGEYYYFKPTTP